MFFPPVCVWLIVFCVLADTAMAAEEPPAVSGPKIRILDLIFGVEDLGGRVQDLKLEETDTEIRIELAADVLFDFDKADIRKDAENTLKQAATLIKEKAKGTVRIEGHTDGKGSDSYNQNLSQRRANSVRDWFVESAGLSDIRFSTSGHGATKPVAPNTKPDGSDNPEGRQKNRRVEIVIGKK